MIDNTLRWIIYTIIGIGIIYLIIRYLSGSSASTLCNVCNQTEKCDIITNVDTSIRPIYNRC